MDKRNIYHTFNRHVVFDLQNCKANHLSRISKISIISFLMVGSAWNAYDKILVKLCRHIQNKSRYQEGRKNTFCSISSPSTCFLKSGLRSRLCKSSLRYFVISFCLKCKQKFTYKHNIYDSNKNQKLLCETWTGTNLKILNLFWPWLFKLKLPNHQFLSILLQFK